MKSVIRISLLSVCALFGVSASGFSETENPDSAASPARPNIVLVMVDDMGFSDIGCYGGEVETPNLDRLAADGLRFTQFYNCAKCETTRTTLMTGRYYTEVNKTKMDNSITIAEALKSSGYRTLMTGKWHLDGSPVERGFEKYFGHLSGACNFFTGDDTFRLGDQPFQVPDSDFYTTDANTDYAIRFVSDVQQETPDKPFFLYIAYNAPHYPLQAKRTDVEKYRGRYRIGWDKLRKARFQKQLEMGLFPEATQLSPRPSNVPAWADVPESEKDHHDLMMSTFAGMIDCVDQNIGRLFHHLEKLGVRENTLFIFLDDNGACPFQRSKKQTVEKNRMPWDANSYWTYDQQWAHACNTPFREYKQNQHEGGITSPMIVNWPGQIKDKGSITAQSGHLVDIMTTCLEVSGTEYPKQFAGKPIGPARGLSLVPIFHGQTRKEHDAIFFSFYGKNNAIRVGDWKLVNINFGKWELYNLQSDRTELNDLSSTHPEQFQKMKEIWKKVASELGEPRKEKKKTKSKKRKNLKSTR
ncbi:MAG: arylsulfatase [Planctomycetota bacterium]